MSLCRYVLLIQVGPLRVLREGMVIPELNGRFGGNLITPVNLVRTVNLVHYSERALGLFEVFLYLAQRIFEREVPEPLGSDTQRSESILRRSESVFSPPVVDLA